ncbi:hypothetical protein SDC9_118673 [bioreactor metagenome]|uniref:Uncharacterized protein n=1 Tax=bioreactor metagenome TaxID=1076179 RepID=A0A645C863_9ZZZZ
MAGNIISLVDKVGRENRFFPEAEMGNRRAAGLFAVIRKIGLHIQVCILSDDLAGRFICPHGTVRAQAPELAADGSVIRRMVLRFGKRCVGYIVHDADGEAVFRLFGFQI